MNIKKENRILREKYKELRESKIDTLILAGIIALAFTAGVGIVGAYVITFDGGLTESHAVWAQFGDFLGGVLNPIFGFLTIIALILTIRIQMRELKLSRKTAERSANSLQKQHEILLSQAHEQRFYRLLENMEKDPDIKQIKDKAADILLILFDLVYKDGIEGADRRISQDELADALKPCVALGFIVQTLQAKTLAILHIINQIPSESDKMIYKTLFQIFLGAPTVSNLYHIIAIVNPDELSLFKKVNMLTVVTPCVVFTTELAKVHDPKEFELNFTAVRESLMAEFDSAFRVE
jgi:uncharacterized membrane protein